MDTRFAIYAPLFPADEPAALGRLALETAGVVEGVRELCGTCGDFSDFHIFPYCRAHLLAVAARHGLADCTMDELYDAYEVLRRDPHPTARLADAFSRISTCQNFDPAEWIQLLGVNPAFIRMAAEDCAFVYWTSGADGSEGLRSLLSTSDRREHLIAHAPVLRSASRGMAEQWRPDDLAYVDSLFGA